MRIFDGIRNAFNGRTHAADLSGREHDPYRSAIGRGDVSFERLIERYKTDVLLHMVVNINTDYTAGRGFHLSVKDDSGKSQHALKLIEDWAEEADLDMLLQEISIDGWLTGNAFLKWTPDGYVKKLPVSEFYQVNVDSEDNPISYRRTRNGNSLSDIPASEILHYKWQSIDDTHFGEGLGQIMERKGIGYLDHDGKPRNRPSIFSINEMQTDVLSKLTYAGLPRWLFQVKNADDKTIDGMSKMMDKMNPLQHLITNSEVKVEEVALSPSNKFDAAFRHMDNQGILGTMSPLPTLWKDMSKFAYNSSESAIDSMIPMIDAFKRALKRFVERQIFKPILEINGLEWSKHKVSLDWGPLDEPKMDDIEKMYNILKDPMFTDRIDPSDLIKMMQENGYPITIKDPPAERPDPVPDPEEMAEQVKEKVENSIDVKLKQTELETHKAKQDAYKAVKERYEHGRRA